MAIREDLVNSAVTFLVEPSVSSAPLDKKIAFLNSKNLTQEEIDVALQRAASDDAVGMSQSTAVNPSGYQYRPAAPPGPGYGGYQGYWQQPPPEIPHRDWRDWFIMATVVGGVGYGLYFTAKRYIVPLIAPPTPPQLESDKAHVDQSFERAFALLDQLSDDTASLKLAEESRTQRLDTALSDLETTIAALKESDRRRDDDARRTADEVRGLRDLIPKALEANKETQDQRLRELGTELKSLKTLVGNRVSGSTTAGAGALRPQNGSYAAGQTTQQAPQPTVNGANGPSATPAATQPSVPNGTGASDSGSAAPTANGAADSAKPSSYSRFTSGKAAIPAWQMAAQKKNDDEKKTNTSESGTVTESTIGA